MIIEKNVSFRGETYKIEIDGYEYKITSKDKTYKGCGIDLTEEGVKEAILRMNGILYDVYKYEKFMKWDGIID